MCFVLEEFAGRENNYETRAYGAGEYNNVSVA